MRSIRISSPAALLFFLTAVLAPASLRAQTISSTELKISSATLQDGQAGVPLSAAFEFTFDRNLPFSSRFNLGFHFEPRRLVARDSAFFGGTRTVRFRLQHQPNTDYIAYAFGVLTCEDSRRQTGCFNPPASTLYLQKRPVVYNYSTVASMGTRDVSGTVTFGNVSQPPAKASRAASLQDLVEAAYTDLWRTAPPPLLSTAATDSLARTMVFLLDGRTVFNQNATAWLPRAGAAANTNGAFTMNHVRDGVYWPVALHFADRFGQTIGRWGYHDANGDFEPDSVVVSGGNVTGLKMVLMQNERILARSLEPTARLRARRLFADAELLTVTALDAQPDGTAALWRYTYYSPAQDSLVTIDGSGFSTAAYVEDALRGIGTRLTVTTPFVNSDLVLQEAESNGGADFRSSYPTGTTPLTVQLGDLNLPFRPAAPSRFWHVRYESPPGVEPARSLEFFFDAETGQRLTGQPVAATPGEVLLPLVLGLPSPHPAQGTTRVTYTLPTGALARLNVYDVLGRHVITLVDERQAAGTHTTSWDASDLAPGTYLLRLQAGLQSAQRAVVVVR